jgi:hypothetical protein
VGRAAKSDVLILRTFDLYNLLSQKMAGQDVGVGLIEALQQGGGWLKAGPDSYELQTE